MPCLCPRTLKLLNQVRPRSFRFPSLPMTHNLFLAIVITGLPLWAKHNFIDITVCEIKSGNKYFWMGMHWVSCIMSQDITSIRFTKETNFFLGEQFSQDQVSIEPCT